MSVEDVTEILGIRLIGVIPDDEQVVIGTNQGEPVISLSSKAGAACKRLTGEEVPFLNFEKQDGLFSRLTKVFKK